VSRLPFVVVYKKNKGRKYFMKVLYIDLEDIIHNKKRNPPIPHEYELIEIGLGVTFIEQYKERYKIKDADIE